jgi:hypothetical protein
MKIFFFTILLMATSQATALQKCIVDGKTLYQSGLCTQGTVVAIPQLEHQVRQGVKIEQQQRDQSELDHQEKQNNTIQMQQQSVQAEPMRQTNQNFEIESQQQQQKAQRCAELESVALGSAQLDSFDEKIRAKNARKMYESTCQ